MAPIEIAPALETDERKARRCGALSIDQVGDEVHVVVRDPDGEVVSVSGPDELFALIALANHALPDGDPRKITAGAVHVLLEITRDAWYGHRAAREREAIALLARSLAAILPQS